MLNPLLLGVAQPQHCKTGSQVRSPATATISGTAANPEGEDPVVEALEIKITVYLRKKK